MCFSTVLGLIASREAVVPIVCPSVTRTSTSASRRSQSTPAEERECPGRVDLGNQEGLAIGHRHSPNHQMAIVTVHHEGHRGGQRTTGVVKPFDHCVRETAFTVGEPSAKRLGRALGPVLGVSPPIEDDETLAPLLDESRDAGERPL